MGAAYICLAKEVLMRLDLSAILLLAAIVLFVLAAFSISPSSVALVPLGLACFAGSFLFGRGRGLFNLRG